MKHTMGLQANFFEMVQRGEKTREYRLWDEKVREIAPGDIIEFYKLPDLTESLQVTVTGLEVYMDWWSCYEAYWKEDFSGRFSSIEDAVADTYANWWPQEQETRWGCLVMSFRLMPASSSSGAGSHPAKSLIWKSPLNEILLGFVLSSFHPTVAYGRHLFPLLGSFLMLAGYCQLRSENRYFYGGWILSIVTLVSHILNIVQNATPYSQNSLWPGAFTLLLEVALLLTLWAALREVCQRRGKPVSFTPILWGFILYACIFTMPVILTSPLQPVVALSALFVYFLFMRSFYLLARDIPWSLSKDGRSHWLCAAKLLGLSCLSGVVLIALCCVCFNHPVLEPVPAEASPRSHLAMPENSKIPSSVSADLTEQDYLLLAGASELSVSSKQLATAKKGSSLQTTTLYFRIPENSNKLYILNHFEWLTGSPNWQDAIAFWAVVPDYDQAPLIESSGLLYEKHGTRFRAPLPRLFLTVRETADPYLMGYKAPAYRIAGLVSYPFASKKQRGYVLCSVILPSEKSPAEVNSAFVYQHMDSPLKYPFQNAAETLAHSEDLYRSGRENQHFSRCTFGEQ